MTEDQVWWIQFIVYLAPPVLGAIFTVIMGLAVKELQKVRSSVDTLNVKIAVVIEKINGHEKRLSKLERSR